MRLLSFSIFISHKEFSICHLRRVNYLSDLWFWYFCGKELGEWRVRDRREWKVRDRIIEGGKKENTAREAEMIYIFRS